MDDYSLVSLSDSRNEWCARLVNTLTLYHRGFKIYF